MNRTHVNCTWKLSFLSNKHQPKDLTKISFAPPNLMTLFIQSQIVRPLYVSINTCNYIIEGPLLISMGMYLKWMWTCHVANDVIYIIHVLGMMNIVSGNQVKLYVPVNLNISSTIIRLNINKFILVHIFKHVERFTFPRLRSTSAIYDKRA